jgi:hypothetical protein
MARVFSFVGLLIVLLVGAWLYTRQASSAMPAGSSNVRAVADITGVQNDLLAIANAERSQFALEGKYLSLDELRSKAVINLPTSGRAGYTYCVEYGSAGFRAVASYSGPAGASPQTISVDQSMQIRTE